MSTIKTTYITVKKVLKLPGIMLNLIFINNKFQLDFIKIVKVP
jgi:hypothetical protein